jgi:hypothetical protein
MEGLPGDAVVREQYLDFFKNRMFRQTLLCHAEVPVSRELDGEQIEGFAVYSAAVAADTSVAAAADAGDGGGVEAPLGTAGSGEQEPPAITFATPEGYTVTTSEQHVHPTLRALGEDRTKTQR